MNAVPGDLHLAHAELEAAHDGALLPLLVLRVRGVAVLVRRLGVAVDDLELADDEDDGPERPRARRRALEELSRQAHGHVDDEVDDPVASPR